MSDHMLTRGPATAVPRESMPPWPVPRSMRTLAGRSNVTSGRLTLTRKRVPSCLRALGRKEMPDRFELDGVVYHRRRTFKHDFFAATGLYEGGGRQVVLKIGRREGFLGLPLGWVGRLLVRHEADLFRRTADLEGVPGLVGVWQSHGLVRDFVPGQALWKGRRLDDAFFTRLQALIEAMHRRGMAYVDLEKPQNVLVGDDGLPYLIDFQISWPWPIGRAAHSFAGRWLCRGLQQGDRYHLRKLQRHFRPDQLTEDELAASYTRPQAVRLYSRLTAPVIRFRRWVLAKVAPAPGPGERGRCDHADGTVTACR